MAGQPYHHGDLKAQLIQKGLTLLDTEGYEHFSLRKAAKLCGVSQTAPYRHFHSKDELVAAITSQALEAFGLALEEAVSLYPDDTEQQLKEMGVAYVRFFTQKPEYLRLLFFSDHQLRMRFAQCKREHDPFLVLTGVLSRYREEHGGITLTQDELILYSWGVVHGIATLIVTGELKNDAETLRKAENVIRKVMK